MLNMLRKMVPLVLSLALLVSGCSSGAPDQQTGSTAPPRGSTKVTVAIDSDVTSLDQTANKNLVDLRVTENIFDGLTRRTAEGEVVPHLAKSYKVSPDGLEWTLTLEQNVKFHNGDPMTAEDFKFSLQRVVRPEFPQLASYWDMVKEIVIVDPYTVSLKLSKPNPLLWNNAPWHLPIVPKNYIERVGEAEFAKKPIGTGPYKVVEWLKDDHITLEAFADYWKGKPAIDRVLFRPLPNESTRTAALLASEVDIAGPFPLDQIGVVEKSANVEVRQVKALERVRVGLDATKPPFNSVKVRQAVNYAVDVDTIIQTVMQGRATRLPGILSDLEWGFDKSMKPSPYDPAKAKALLSEAGYPNGFEIPFMVRAGYPKALETAQVIAGYLAAVGIKVNIQPIDAADYAKKSEARQLTPMFFTGWGGGGVFHADQVFRVLLACKGGSQIHAGYYCNPLVDKSFQEAMAVLTSDPEKAKSLLSNAQRIVQEDAANLFLFQTFNIYGVNKQLDWQPAADGGIWLFGARFKK